MKAIYDCVTRGGAIVSVDADTETPVCKIKTLAARTHRCEIVDVIAEHRLFVELEETK